MIRQKDREREGGGGGGREGQTDRQTDRQSESERESADVAGVNARRFRKHNLRTWLKTFDREYHVTR